MIHLVALIISIFASQPTAEVDECREPLLEYRLEVSGKVHTLRLNEPTQLDGTYENPKLVLRAGTVRKFPYGSVEFEYPAAFGWEADLETPGAKMWTLSGNDCDVMFHAFQVEISPKAYLSQVVGQMGLNEADIRDHKCDMGGKQSRGLAVSGDIMGSPVKLEVYAIPTPRGSRLLILQDFPPEGLRESNEAAEFKKLLARTFIDRLAVKESEAAK